MYNLVLIGLLNICWLINPISKAKSSRVASCVTQELREKIIRQRLVLKQYIHPITKHPESKSMFHYKIIFMISHFNETSC